MTTHAINQNVLEMLEELTEAAQAVIDSWEHGDLAGAVNMLDGLITTIRTEIAKAKGRAV